MLPIFYEITHVWHYLKIVFTCVRYICLRAEFQLSIMFYISDMYPLFQIHEFVLLIAKSCKLDMYISFTY